MANQLPIFVVHSGQHILEHGTKSAIRRIGSLLFPPYSLDWSVDSVILYHNEDFAPFSYFSRPQHIISVDKNNYHCTIAICCSDKVVTGSSGHGVVRHAFVLHWP